MYRSRVVDAEVAERLGRAGALVIEGAKAVGKTSTASQFAESEVRLDVDVDARQAAELDPSLVLTGDRPRLLDEWQMVPALWAHVRRAVDDANAPGQFLLAGSATPEDDVARHSGAGRFSFVRMRPMTLFESGHSSGEISFRALLNGGDVVAADTGATVRTIAERVVAGGWPGNLGLTTESAGAATGDYLTQVCEVDVRQVADGHRDPVRVRRLLRAYARNIAQEASRVTLADDAGIEAVTVDNYLNALTRLMVVEEQPAWAPSLRARARVRGRAKRHFVDPALAAAALGIGGADPLIGQLDYLGQLFESLVVRDLRVFAQAVDAPVLHYRDETKLEVDAVIERSDGRWAAFEVKLNPAKVDDAAAALLRLAAKVDADRNGEPLCLGVVTATGYGYRRPDGVAVVPIGALGP